MGYYLNPPDMTSEAWLLEHGTMVSVEQVKQGVYETAMVPVCLVDNGWMKTAGICYDRRERDAFLYPCGRPKRWFLVERSKLVPYCPQLEVTPLAWS